MKIEALVVAALAAGGCGKSDNSSATKPMEAPTLSAAGDVKVPPGHETTFSFDGKATTLEYTWLEVLNFEGKPAIRILAQGGPSHGLFTMAAAIPEGTSSLSQMAGTTIGALPGGVSFGNTPEMATGTGATIKIDEVTADHVAGTFEAQACKHGERTCTNPKQVTGGKFRAFRSALSDDAAFTRYTKK